MIHKNFILPEDRFYGESSYTNSYNKQNGTPNKPNEKFLPKHELELSKSPFEGNSSYAYEYINKGQGSRA